MLKFAKKMTGKITNKFTLKRAKSNGKSKTNKRNEILIRNEANIDEINHVVNPLREQANEEPEPLENVHLEPRDHPVINLNKNNVAILKKKIQSYKKYDQLNIKRNKSNTRVLDYGISGKERLIYTTLQDLNKEIGNKSAVNYYRGIILGGTIITVTGLISTALATTIVLAPLAAVLGVVSSKLNDYIQNKYLWTINSKDSFSDVDLETFMNVSKLYYRILLSPFLNKVLKKHMRLFKHGNYALDIIKKNPNKHQSILRQNREDEKLFDEEYNISGWVEHQIVNAVERLSNVIEQIYALNLVNDKIKFQALYNLFMSHYNQTLLLIELYQTKYDHLEWRHDIEIKEKEITIESTKHIKEEFEKHIVKNSKVKHWFSRSTVDTYKLNKTDLNKVMELMK